MTEEERRGRIGEKYSPGDGQLEYELSTYTLLAVLDEPR